MDQVTYKDPQLTFVPEQIRSNLKKIADIPKPCLHPEHYPPSHVVLEPGVYSYTCPGCNKEVQFTVPARY